LKKPYVCQPVGTVSTFLSIVTNLSRIALFFVQDTYLHFIENVNGPNAFVDIRIVSRCLLRMHGCFYRSGKTHVFFSILSLLLLSGSSHFLFECDLLGTIQYNSSILCIITVAWRKIFKRGSYKTIYTECRYYESRLNNQ
jgi:hypothetical protein